MNIIEDPNLTEFYRRPRSKKKRILKKWRKRPSNHRPDMKIYQVGDTLIMHPVMAAAIRKIQRAIEDNIFKGLGPIGVIGGTVAGSITFDDVARTCRLLRPPHLLTPLPIPHVLITV